MIFPRTHRWSRIQHFFVAICGVWTLSSCFATRTPEPPDLSRSIFTPPTSPQIVIENLRASVRDKLAENYVLCLMPNEGNQTFVFEPSADASGRFSSIFSQWNIARERQAFLTMIAPLGASQNPQLILTNNRFDAILPDSALYVADYILRPNITIQGLPPEFAGRMLLTLRIRPTGFWAVSRWIDQQSVSTAATWSILKARLVN